MALVFGDVAAAAMGLFFIGLAALVFFARPGGALNRVLGAFLLLRGAGEVVNQLASGFEASGAVEDAAVWHAVGHWYTAATPLLTLLLAHDILPPNGRARWRWWALGAATVATLVISPLVDGLMPSVAVPHGERISESEPFEEALRVFLWGARGVLVVAAAYAASSPLRGVLHRRQASLVGLAFVFLMGHSIVFTLARATLLGQFHRWEVPSTPLAALCVASTLVLLPRLLQPFEGRARLAATVAAAVPFTVGTAVVYLPAWYSVSSLLMIAAFAICLALAVVRYDLIGLGPRLQRRVETFARGMLAAGALLLPAGIALAWVGSTSAGLVVAVALGTGALAISPKPARVMGRGLKRVFAPDPLDPAVAAERARIYADALGKHPDDAPRLSALRDELGLAERDHLALAQMLAERRDAPAGQPPLLLGRYVVRRELGRGASGAALLVLDLATGREVVLKSFHARHAERRALAEAEALAKVRHPRIVPLLSVERAGDQVFLVLEHVEGGSLKDLLEREGPLPPGRAVALVLDVLEGLDALHAAGLAHGDVKPGNVLLDAQGRALLADLGASQALSREERDATLTASPVLGTYSTMAPEILRGSRGSASADLYSAGALLYRLLTGEDYVDVSGKGVAAATEAILHEPPRLPHPRVPTVLEPLLARALAKRPQERPPNAGTMRRELAGFGLAVTVERRR